jgi:hypothetical protein
MSVAVQASCKGNRAQAQGIFEARIRGSRRAGHSGCPGEFYGRVRRGRGLKRRRGFYRMGGCGPQMIVAVGFGGGLR